MYNPQSFINKEVSINLGENVVNGILTHPNSKGPYPAVVLLHGSARSGVDDPYLKLNAENLVQTGFAILRYDGPGWGGQSSLRVGIETFDERKDEAIRIVDYLQGRDDIQSKMIGLWGISQGGWICQMAAASNPEIAFIIPVSGPGMSPGEQEVYRVEAQTKAAGYSKTDTHKALIIRRLMIDILLDEPHYQAENLATTSEVGDGPWMHIMDIIYSAEKVEAEAEFKYFVSALKSIVDEPWAEFLYLDMVLKVFESFPANEWNTVKRQMRAVAMMNPRDYLPRIKCPVLAIFGAADKLVPVDRSVSLYKKYLTIAGNSNVTINVFPEADHGIFIGKQFAPGYVKTVNKWLSLLME